MQMAILMPLRLVDQNGRPVYARGTRNKKAVASALFGLESDGGLNGREDERNQNSEFGSIVPYDSTITLGEEYDRKSLYSTRLSITFLFLSLLFSTFLCYHFTLSLPSYYFP